MCGNSRHILYYGRPEPLPERHRLAAGPLSAIFEEGQLLDVCWRGREVLRRVYVAVRDQDWGTVPLRLADLDLQQHADSFRITFDGRHQRDEVDFFWKASIEGSSRGRLTFSMEGEALSSFRRSRIGFCLLHSAQDCAGKNFDVHRPDGTRVRGCFPGPISQEQPIAGTEAISALSYELSRSLGVSIQFEGDVFQMEDQRNWTDATFKTFSTPLELPCPVEVAKDDRVFQSIRVLLRENQPTPAASTYEDTIAIDIGVRPAGAVPSIGLGLASHGESLTRKEVRLLRALRLSHLRADLKLWESDWRDVLHRGVIESRELGCGLEAAVFVSDSAEEELHAFRSAIEQEQPPVCRWLVFHHSELATSERWILLARKFLQSWDPAVPFGSGTNASFYEVSGFRRPAGGLNYICFSIHAQEHASDNSSLVETLAIQKQVVENARRVHGGLPVLVSPVTLKARFNPYATVPERPIAGAELPRQVDPRQMSLFGAVWTLGSLAYLSEGGASSVTYYETTGWRGVMERETGSPSESFPSIPGAVFPLYHVLADLAPLAGGEIVPVHSNRPLRVCAMAARKGATRRVLVGNLTGETLRVLLCGLPERIQVTTIDESSALEAIIKPEEFRSQEPQSLLIANKVLVTELLPYSITSILSTDAQR